MSTYKKIGSHWLFAGMSWLLTALPLLAQPPAEMRQREEQSLKEPFVGITTTGKPLPNLFPVQRTGVSTAPIQAAAKAFLASLTSQQQAQTQFAADDSEWRKWSNVDFYQRQGMGFAQMSLVQQKAALNLLKTSLSAKGFQLAWDIRHLNQTLGELTHDFTRLNENLYWLTIMGTPSATQPWGWQIDGHHLVINYFVLGDQVVMSPVFMGSEPVTATSGQYAGTSVLQPEQNKGLTFINALTPTQRTVAILDSSKTHNNNLTEAFKDNVVLDDAGIRGVDLSVAQKNQLLDLIQEYVSDMEPGHARVKMDEVRQHLDQTYFAWIGGTGAGSVFYYRIQSPVILIEFDHQSPVFLGRESGPPMGGPRPNGPPAGGPPTGGPPPQRAPTRQHIHTVVRTPNGNDYGKDLLREHYAQYPHNAKP